jgi:undecaprenyl-diphosphatase
MMNFPLRIKNLLLKVVLLSGCLCFLDPSAYSQNFEVRLLRKINPANPTSDWWMAASKSAKPVSFGLPIGMLATALITKDKKLQDNGFETLGTLAITTIVTTGIKNIVDRPRPYQTHSEIYPDHVRDGKSLPSGHTSIAFGTATTMSIQNKRWYVVVPAYTWATAVGYSRMYLGQHYPSDVVAGALTGAGSAWLSHKANVWLRKKTIKKRG